MQKHGGESVKMASVKFEKGSQEFQFFRDFWVFVQDFFIPEDDGVYWDSVLKRSQELESKYSGDFFQSMILAFIDYAERKVKE